MTSFTRADEDVNIYERLLVSAFTPEPEKTNYELMHIIGQGGYGQVKKVRHRKTGKLGAMKKLAFDPEGKSNKKLLREILCIIRLRSHENIVQMLDIFRSENNSLCIVMELCRCDLADFWEIKENQTTKLSFYIAHETVKGIDYLHNRVHQIVHGDVKPQNILIAVQPGSRKVLVKITDFGISTSVDLNDVAKNNIVLEGVAKALARDLGFSNVSGTFPYMAPEMFDAINNCDGVFQMDTSVDIFALGMVFTFIFSHNDSDYGKSFILKMRNFGQTKLFLQSFINQNLHINLTE